MSRIRRPVRTESPLVYRNDGSGRFEAMSPVPFAGSDRYFGAGRGARRRERRRGDRLRGPAPRRRAGRTLRHGGRLHRPGDAAEHHARRPRPRQAPGDGGWKAAVSDAVCGRRCGRRRGACRRRAAECVDLLGILVCAGHRHRQHVGIEPHGDAGRSRRGDHHGDGERRRQLHRHAAVQGDGTGGDRVHRSPPFRVDAGQRRSTSWNCGRGSQRCGRARACLPCGGPTRS